MLEKMFVKKEMGAYIRENNTNRFRIHFYIGKYPFEDRPVREIYTN